jgi:hypothetical protein
MFDEKIDKNGNIYLIYILSNINISVESYNLKEFIQLKNFELNYEHKNIYLSYIKTPEKLDYRLFENRINVENIINYNEINNDIKYNYPIIIFSKNINTIIKNSKDLIPDKETYGIIGE